MASQNVSIKNQSGLHIRQVYAIITCIILYTWLFLQISSHTLAKCPLQFMSVYNNENIRKIAKLIPREFPHLVQSRENTHVSVHFITFNRIRGIGV